MVDNILRFEWVGSSLYILWTPRLILSLKGYQLSGGPDYSGRPSGIVLEVVLADRYRRGGVGHSHIWPAEAFPENRGVPGKGVPMASSCIPTPMAWAAEQQPRVNPDGVLATPNKGGDVWFYTSTKSAGQLNQPIGLRTLLRRYYSGEEQMPNWTHFIYLFWFSYSSSKIALLLCLVYITIKLWDVCPLWYGCHLSVFPRPALFF